MNVQELLPSGGINALASQLGVPREQAQRGAEALLPSVLGGMGDKAHELDTHVNSLGGARLADNVIGPEPTEVDRGNLLLGGIFGSKDVSRQVASHASQSSGLDPAPAQAHAADPRNAGGRTHGRPFAGSGRRNWRNARVGAWRNGRGDGRRTEWQHRRPGRYAGFHPRGPPLTKPAASLSGSADESTCFCARGGLR